MTTCRDREIARLLHAYELGLLNDTDRKRVELHVHECDQCFQELLEMEAASHLLRSDEQVRQTASELARNEKRRGITRLVWPSSWRVIAPVVVTAAIVVFLVLKDWRLEIQTEEPAQAIENRVAILPFANLTRSAENAEMGDVVANLLITGMSQASSLQIVSSQYIFDLSRQVSRSPEVSRSNTAETVARRARARWLVDGAISQVSSEMVVTAQLIDVPSGTVKSASRVSINNDRSVFAAIDQLATEMRLALIQPAFRAQEVYQPIANLTTSSPEAYQEYIRGLDFNRKFIYSQARLHFLKAGELDSTFAMPCYYLSVLAESPGPRQWLEKALKLADRASDRDRYFIRSRAAMLAGDWKSHLQILNEFVERYKDEKEPLLELGSTEYSYSMYPKAIKHLEMAVALDSSFGSAWNQLAYAYDRSGDFERAIKAADRYVATAPDEPNPYDSRGEIYARNGRLDQAVASYRQAVLVNPAFVPSLTSLGVMSLFKGDLARADSCFDALTKGPIPANRKAARMYQCYVLAYRGKFKEALDLADRSAQADSADGFRANQPPALFWRSTVHEAMGNIAAALNCVERSIAADSGVILSDGARRIAVYNYLLTLSGREKEANQQAEKLLKTLDSVGYHHLPYILSIASVAIAAHSPEKASMILDKNADTAELFHDLVVLGRANLEANRPARAVALFEEANTQYTVLRLFWGAESVKLHYYLGQAYERSQRTAQALNEYRIFLNLWKDADPGTKEIADARQRLAAVESQLKDSLK